MKNRILDYDMNDLRERILSRTRADTKKVDVKEWDTSLYVRSWSARERGKLLAWHQAFQNDPAQVESFDSYVCAFSVCDENGERVFDDKDVDAIQDLNGAVVSYLAQEALAFNGLGQDAIDNAKKN